MWLRHAEATYAWSWPRLGIVFGLAKRFRKTIWGKKDFEKYSGNNDLEKRLCNTSLGKNDLGQMLGKSNWKHDCEQTILVKTDFEDCSGKSDLEKTILGKKNLKNSCEKNDLEKRI